MGVLLDEFRYYFSLTGTSGGLRSMEWEFRPVSVGEGGNDELRTMARDIVNTHTDVLDRFYSGIIDGEREPVLMDSAHSVSTGYQYAGRIKKKSQRALQKHLREVFGEDAPESPEKLSTYKQLQATVECSFTKRGNDLVDGKVVLRHDLTHTINVCMLRFIQRLEGTEIGQKPRANMESLERTLERTSERTNADYLKMITSQS